MLTCGVFTRSGAGADALDRAPPSLGRVCQAWHSAGGVPVPTPGMRGAAGEGQGRGVGARCRLGEAPSNGAGRRPGTRDEGRATRDAWARDHDVRQPRVGGFAQSGAYARAARCLPLGGRQAGGARSARRQEAPEPKRHEASPAEPGTGADGPQRRLYGVACRGCLGAAAHRWRYAC